MIVRMVDSFGTAIEVPEIGGLPWQQASRLAALAYNARAALTVDPGAARGYLEEMTTVLAGVAPLERIEVRPASVLPDGLLKKGGLAPWQLRRILIHIARNLSNAMTLKELSALCGLSSSHFGKAFKISMGDTVHGFISRQRIKQAQAMMLSTGEPLCAIAAACGFSDQAHFSRRFRQEAGESPLQWRLRRKWG